MKIPEFKTSKRFLRDINLPCLVATVKNSELPTVVARNASGFKTDPKCEIYLRGKEPKKMSGWQQEILEQLFEKEGLAYAVAKGMKECNSTASGGYDDLDEVELQQIKERGIEAFIMITLIAIDEVTQEVIIKAHTTFDCVLDEHGLVFVQKDGSWRFEEGDYLSRLQGAIIEQQEAKERKVWETAFPSPESEASVDNDAPKLFGVWRYSPDESTRVHKLLGSPAGEVKKASTFGLSEGRYFTPTIMERLSKGLAYISRDVAKYEQRGNLVAVHYVPSSRFPHPADEYWCDGNLLVQRFGKNVFTCADDSYRKGEPIPNEPEDPLQARIKQTAMELLKMKHEKT